MSEKYQYYNGLKFTRDEQSGYYLNSTFHIRMHRYVWVCENGDIPKGYDVHHKDSDKSNNDISNLELLTIKEHHRKHWEEKPESEKQWFIDNVSPKGREAAAKWHKSEEGKKWHSEHMKNMHKNGLINKKRVFVCEQCGKEFEIVYKPGHKFCSGACQQKYLRAHQPLVKRVCVVCNKEYECKQDSLSTTCSRSCGNVLRGRTLRKRGN